VKVKVPTFSAKSGLVRYVNDIHRLKNNRPAVASFLPDLPSANPADDHLSVNSLEAETIKEIAAYYRWKWQNGLGRVALCVHKVYEYSEAGKKGGVSITYSRGLSIWQFLSLAGKQEAAYKHRPVRRHDNPFGSPSHSGVEFVRALSEHGAACFARRLSGKKFHLLT
jgi:hypothetical protein